MDNIDVEILNLLKKDGRMTYTKISKEVNLSVPSVIDRIKHLHDREIIKNCTIEIDYQSLGRSIQAIISVDVDSDKYDGFKELCLNNGNILDFYRVVGPYSAMLKVAVKNTHELEDLIDKIKEYGTCSTSVITTTFFKDKILSNILVE